MRGTRTARRDRCDAQDLSVETSADTAIVSASVVIVVCSVLDMVHPMTIPVTSTPHIHHASEIEKTLVGRDVRDVAESLLVGAIGSEVVRGCNFLTVIARRFASIMT